MTIVEILLTIYLCSLFMVVSIIIIDTQVNKYPNSLLSRWWKKHIVSSNQEYDDET